MPKRLRDHEYEQMAVLMYILTTLAGIEDVIKKITKTSVIYARPVRDTKGVFRDGIYFIGVEGVGHFVACRNGELLNSYAQGFQRSGTNGFCQTFAMMNYLGKTTDLVPGRFINNAAVACEFLLENAKYLHPYFKSICEQTVYDYPFLNLEEFKEDINKLIDYGGFGNILQEEAVPI